MKRIHKVFTITAILFVWLAAAYPAWISWLFYHRHRQLAPFDNFWYESTGSYISVYALGWSKSGKVKYEVDSDKKLILFTFSEDVLPEKGSSGPLMPKEWIIGYMICYKNQFWDAYCRWPVK